MWILHNPVGVEYCFGHNLVVLYLKSFPAKMQLSPHFTANYHNETKTAL